MRCKVVSTVHRHEVLSDFRRRPAVKLLETGALAWLAWLGLGLGSGFGLGLGLGLGLRFGSGLGLGLG